MKPTQLLKFVAGVLAFGAWVALVMMGKANPDQLVAALALTITGLGVHGATTSTPDAATTAPLSAAELPPAPLLYPAESNVLTPAPAPVPAQGPKVAPMTFLTAEAAQTMFQ
ncbi:hypothetical protein M3A49_40920 [Paraburkholderia sp. CNPSo 3076]|uniref:hypothetical protein n=1 Tax=Paraburkholderia sp. CNPSo 3076 TaxID=2940936 RepID=UPI0022569781|nr:hypothetical protein [Paraburkholderia sp. CNPSo 3076]MCX5545705.1 hypothetical protein [Paraburkholderia sp. CNPSo 3076]